MLQTSSAKLPPAEHIGRFTVDQYCRMIEAGIFGDRAPYELLDGVLVIKDRSTRGEDLMTIGGPHNRGVGRLVALNSRLAGHGCHMQIQGPILIPPLHVPEPDGAILRGQLEDYTDLPSAADACAVFEVSDSSLDQDRTSKAAIYAGAGIPQYFLVNLVDRVVEIFEQPNLSKRKYEACRVAKPAQKLSIALADGTRLEIRASELLP